MKIFCERFSKMEYWSLEQTKNSQCAKEQERQETPKEGFRESFVTAAVAELTDDALMTELLADTAQTTLREQKEGKRVPADNAAAVIDEADDMSQIFENASNWAAIAFNET